MSLKLGILVWYPDQNCHTPSLKYKNVVRNIGILVGLNYKDSEVAYYIMNTFKSLYHGIDVSSAFDRPINTAISHLSKNLEHGKRKSIKNLILPSTTKIVKYA